MTRRRRSHKIDNDEIFTRVKEFFDNDIINRDFDRQARLERYAKFRMWTDEKNWPWDDASNVPLSDMMEQSLSAQDTIFNAAIAARPIINARAIQKQDKDKEETIDNLIDYQVFEENPGELLIGDATDAFINDGVLTIFCPWVKEMREMADLRVFGPAPEGMLQNEYLRQVVVQSFPEAPPIVDPNGWDFTAQLNGEPVDIKFYDKADGDFEMFTSEQVEVFNGPKPIVVDYDDILHPPRCTNLQIKGPSNPGGASHVILVDNPSIDELKRLQKNKFYDLMTKEDADDLESFAFDERNDQEEKNRDILNGQDADLEDREHKVLNRLLVFDTFDIDGDGIEEDVIFWVILELKKVIKVALLGELYPIRPPMRPFAEAPLIPIRGRRTGISILEMLEGLHDVSKAIMDQAVDSGTMSNVPFFFYRAVAGVRPEVITMTPGEGYPVADPSRDINFPQIGNPNAQNFALNMLTILEQMKERATVIGDIQLGRVPTGKSSALRTASGLALLTGQGESRPERLLRRFFIAFAQLWKLIHALNQAFLPKNKQYRISGYGPTKDPYQEVKDPLALKGVFQFRVQGVCAEYLEAEPPRFFGNHAGYFRIGSGHSVGDYRFRWDLSADEGLREGVGAGF